VKKNFLHFSFKKLMCIYYVYTGTHRLRKLGAQFSTMKNSSSTLEHKISHGVMEAKTTAMEAYLGAMETFPGAM
jgi:hypothetical protein